MAGVEQWQPRFPGQRPPFQPGHELSTTHGAYSQRKLQPVAEALVDAILADPQTAYLAQPSYRPALNAWAQAEARVVLLEAWIDRMPEGKATDSSRGRTPPLELLRQWEASASKHRQRLGLDPLSRARLGRDIASARVDLAAVLTEQRERSEADRGDD